MKVILTTISTNEAKNLVRQLLELRVIACGNIVQSAQSLYWWNGEIQEEEESVIIMETTDEQVDNARQTLQDFHPYDVPKILIIEPVSANKKYVEWLSKEVRK